MPTPQFFQGLFSQLASKACIVDTIPPTFAGVSSSTAENSGGFLVQWLAATDANPPVQYRIYVALGVVSAATLFALNPVKIIRGMLLARVFTLTDQATYFIKGQQYTIGVRAEDSIGNIDSNVIILTPTAIATGDLPTVLQDLATDLYNTELDLAQDHADFVSSLSVFNGYLLTLSGYLTTFSTYLTTLGTHLATFNSYLVTLSGYLSTFATYLSTMATNNTNAATNNTTMSGHLTTFDTELDRFENDIDALEAIIGNAYVPGALNLDIQENIMDLEILSEETEL